MIQQIQAQNGNQVISANLDQVLLLVPRPLHLVPRHNAKREKSSYAGMNLFFS